MKTKFTEIHQIKPNLWALDEIGKTIMYVYEGEKRVLLLDTGFGLTNLKELVNTLCPGKEIIVVNSHGHSDHNSGNNQFDKVYVGSMDEPNSHTEITEGTKTRLMQNFITTNPRAAGIEAENWYPGPAKKIVSLIDEDVIDLGGICLEVLETPGHSMGSICLFDRENGYLFTGDLMLTWEVWGQLPSSTSLNVYSHSLDRLAQLQCMVTEVFPAHGVPDNPFGWPIWHLPPRVLTVYAEGTRKILNHTADNIKPYICFATPGMVSMFEIGGMAFDPERLGTDT